MKNRYLLVFVFVLALFWVCLPAFGQTVWEKKPYQEWSFSDATNMLFRSPWGKVEVATDIYSHSSPVNIRLLSALPSREAIVRVRQIQRGYDKFSAADKAKFDSEVKDFLECPGCAKYYIVALRTMGKDPTVLQILKTLALADLKSYVSLISDKGDRRDLVQFIPPDTEDNAALLFHTAVFFFERFDEQGKPLLTTENKKFYFQIDGKLFKGKVVQKVTFDISKLTHTAEIIF